MISKSDFTKKHIGNESYYMIEKSLSAIHKDPEHYDVELVKKLLNTYKKGIISLNNEIISHLILDQSYFEYEIKTLIYALDRMDYLLGKTKTDDEKLEAYIMHDHIHKQNNKIRKSIDEELA